MISKLKRYFYLVPDVIRSIFLSNLTKKDRLEQVDVLVLLFYQDGRCRLSRLVERLKRKGVVCAVVDGDLETHIRLGHIRISVRALRRPIIMVFSYMVSKYQPKIVCVMDDNMEKEVHDFFKSKNILLCNLAHCPTGTSPRFSSLHYDHYFCFGGLSHRRLGMLKKSHAGSDCKVHPCGSPFWQRSSRIESAFSVDGAVGHLRQRGSGAVIGVFGSYFHPASDPLEHDDYLKYIENLIRFMSDHSRHIFLYKDHPVKEDPEIRQKILDNDNVFLWQGDILEFVRLIDLAIMKSSAASIECAAFGKPFIIIEWSSKEVRNLMDREYLQDCKYFDRVNDFSDLSLQIDRRLDENWEGRRWLDEYYKLHIGSDNSLDYISDKISELLET